VPLTKHSQTVPSKAIEHVVVLLHEVNYFLKFEHLMLSESLQSFLKLRTAPLVLVAATPGVGTLLERLFAELFQRNELVDARSLGSVSIAELAVQAAPRIFGVSLTETDKQTNLSKAGSEDSRATPTPFLRFLSVHDAVQYLNLREDDPSSESHNALAWNSPISSGALPPRDVLRCWQAALRKQKREQLSLGNASSLILSVLSLAPFGLPHFIFDHPIAQVVFASVNDSEDDILNCLLRDDATGCRFHTGTLDSRRPLFILEISAESSAGSDGMKRTEIEFSTQDGSRGTRIMVDAAEWSRSADLREYISLYFGRWIHSIIQSEIESRVDQRDRAGRIVRNQFRAWFSSGQSKTREGVIPGHRLGLSPRVMPYIYLWNSAEMRAFFLGYLLVAQEKYSEALAVFRMLSSDFRADHSLIYSAAASECQAIALILKGSNESLEVMELLQHATENYRNAGRFLDAVRTLTLLATTCIEYNNLSRAADLLLEESLPEMDWLRKAPNALGRLRKLCTAACLELAGECFRVLRRPRRHRTCQMCLSMAAECFTAAKFFDEGHRLFARICDHLAKKSWSWIEAYVNLCTGRTAWMCGNISDAYQRYTAFLSDLKPSRVDDIAVLRETVLVASALGEATRASSCRFPLLDHRSIVFAEENRILESPQLSEWKAMWEALDAFREAQRTLEAAGASIDQQHWDAELTSLDTVMDLLGGQERHVHGMLRVSAGEKIVVTCRLENPLRAPIELDDIILRMRRVSMNHLLRESGSSARLCVPVETVETIRISHNSDGLLRGVFAISESGAFEVEGISWRVHSPLFEPSLICYAFYELNESPKAMNSKDLRKGLGASSRESCGHLAVEVGPPAPLLTLNTPLIPKTVMNGEIWHTSITLANSSLVDIHNISLSWSPESDLSMRVMQCTSSSTEVTVQHGRRVVSVRCTLQHGDSLEFKVALWCRHHISERSMDLRIAPRFLRLLIFSTSETPTARRSKLLPVRIGVLAEDSVSVLPCHLEHLALETTSPSSITGQGSAVSYGNCDGTIIGLQIQNVNPNGMTLEIQHLHACHRGQYLWYEPLFTFASPKLALQQYDKANLLLHSKPETSHSGDDPELLSFVSGTDFEVFLPEIFPSEPGTTRKPFDLDDLFVCLFWRTLDNGDGGQRTGLTALNITAAQRPPQTNDYVQKEESLLLAADTLAIVPCEHGVRGEVLVPKNNAYSSLACVDTSKIPSDFAVWSGHIFKSVALRKFASDAQLDVFLISRDPKR